jgi:peptidoglycan/LPS O-acetylase OafA/YrhL
MHTLNRFQELDAIRGLAALSVLLFHFTSYQKVREVGFHFAYGVTGVDIFFMISGFVIFLTINKTKKWQDFIVSRFSRLYPTYWACVTLTGIFILIYQPSTFSIPQFAANLTMFPCYFGEEDLDGTYWTLLIELLFYFWILIIFIFNGLKRIIPIALCCTIGIMVFHYFATWYPNFYWFAGKKLQLINHFPLFFSGILFYKVKFNGFSLKYLLLITLCFLSTFYLHDKGGRSYQMISLSEHQWIILFYHVIFFLFVYGKLTFLIREPLLYLGKISYSLYLLHQFIGLQLIGTFHESLHLHIYPAMALSTLICIGFADFITRYIEKPAIDHIRNWYKNKEKATSAFNITE